MSKIFFKNLQGAGPTKPLAILLGLQYLETDILGR